jgi:hypothetical protein
MRLNEKTNLKLIAKNQEDLKVLSAYLQDSITSVKNIVYLKKNRCFVMMVNRFMWEDVEKGVFRKNKRIRCVVKFDGVFTTKSKNINQKNKNKALEYLAIECTTNKDGFYRLNIFFSGNSLITITTEVIEVILHDLGEPWNVKYAPIHKI